MWFFFPYSSSFCAGLMIFVPICFCFFPPPVPLSVEVEFLFECSFGFLPICPRFLHEGFFRAEHFCSCIFCVFSPLPVFSARGFLQSSRTEALSLSRRLLSSSLALAGALTLDFLIAEFLLLLLLIFILAAQLKSWIVKENSLNFVCIFRGGSHLCGFLTVLLGGDSNGGERGFLIQAEVQGSRNSWREKVKVSIYY